MDFDKITIDKLNPSEYNPRQISNDEMSKLSKNLGEFGLVDPIIIDLTDNNTIIGGHQRYKALQKKYEKKDTELNLLKLGDIGWVFEDKELKIKDKNHQKALNISLNRIQGEWDYDKLNKLLDGLRESHFNMELTGFEINTPSFEFSQQDNNSTEKLSEGKVTGKDASGKKSVDDEGDKFNRYTQRVNTPVYEIKGECPTLPELYDDTKTKELISEINQSNITNEQKLFLTNTAYRMTSYDYSKIAEYYAHQNKEMQELMEKLILIIIDFDKAIEEGYVKISEKYRELVKQYEE